MKYIILLLLSVNSYAFDHEHRVWANVLKTYVSKSGAQTYVDYKKLKKSPKGLNSYLKEVSSVKKGEYKAFNNDQRLAFLINAYNAFTLKIIIKNYPVESIKDIGNFFRSTWKIEFFKLLGEKSHLDHIEHGIIRKKFDEPRIHFAVNCASIGCPSLHTEPFTAAKLDSQLDFMAKSFLMNKKKNYIKKKTLYVSSIFKWYGDDFKKKYKSYKHFISTILGDKVLKMDIEYLDYNWKLNQVNL